MISFAIIIANDYLEISLLTFLKGHFPCSAGNCIDLIFVMFLITLSKWITRLTAPIPRLLAIFLIDPGFLL